MPSDEQRLQCGREACTSTADPRGWNAMTGLMYCSACAMRIRRHAGDFFPLLDTPLRGDMPHGVAVRVRRHQVQDGDEST